VSSGPPLVASPDATAEPNALPPTVLCTVNIGSLMQRGIRFIGNGQAPTHKYMQEIMDDYLVTGKVKPTELFVSHRITIDDVANCYYKFDDHDKELRIIKPFVQTKYSTPGALILTTLPSVAKTF